MWRFGVLSDIQESVDKVQDIFDIMNQDTELQFIVSSGDLTVAGRESQLTRIQEKLKGLNVPFFSTVGNHEMGVRNPYLWHKLFGRHSFHFQYRGVHFSLIDSASASVDPMVYDFLDDWIEISIAQTHIFVTHVPPLDPVSVRSHAFRSRREAAKLLTRLARGHVDVTLYGHIHSYYAFSNAGIPAYISGGGGATPEQMDGIGRHYLTVEVSADQGVKSVFAVRVPD
jgi:predicted phosphodiesterase